MSKKRMIALYDYDAEAPEELALLENDIVVVLSEDPSGWWKGDLNGKVGIFPSNFCEEYVDEGGDDAGYEESTPAPKTRAPPVGAPTGFSSELANVLKKSSSGSIGASGSRPARGGPPKRGPPTGSRGASPAGGPPKRGPPNRGGPSGPRGGPGGKRPNRGGPPKRGQPSGGRGAPQRGPNRGVPSSGGPIRRTKTQGPLRKLGQSAPVRGGPRGVPGGGNTRARPPNRGGPGSRGVPGPRGGPGGPRGGPGARGAPGGSRGGPGTPPARRAPKIEKPAKKKVKALYDYEETADGELSFFEGELITVDLEDPSGWWKGTKEDGTQGWFPANFIEPIEDTPEESPMDVLDAMAKPHEQVLAVPKRIAGQTGRRRPTVRRQRKRNKTAVNIARSATAAIKPSPSLFDEGASKPTSATPTRTPVAKKAVPPGAKKSTPVAKKVAPGLQKSAPSGLQKAANTPKKQPVAKGIANTPTPNKKKSAEKKQQTSGNSDGPRWTSDLPPFETFCEELCALFDSVKSKGNDGKPALFDDIPSKAPHGIALCTVDGYLFHYGDSKECYFSLQGCIAPFVYGVGKQKCGDAIDGEIGLEPLKKGGREYAMVLDKARKPINPFVNTGLMTVCGMLLKKSSKKDVIRSTLDMCKNFSGKKISCGMGAYIDMKETDNRDIALGHWMKANKAIDGNIDDILDLFFQLRSIEVNCESFAKMAATLANDGVNPLSKRTCLANGINRDVTKAVKICGNRGGGKLVAHASISGAVMVIVPGLLGIAIYSPMISKEVSSFGTALCDALATKYPTFVK